MSPSRPLSFRDDYKAGDDLQGLFLLFVNWRGVAIHHTGLGHKMMVFVQFYGGHNHHKRKMLTCSRV